MKKSKAVETFTKALQPLFGAYNSSYKKLATNVLSQPIMMSTFLDKNHDAYIWLLKATIFNRGRGIELFSSLQQLEKFIKEYSDGTFDRNLHLAEDNHQSNPTDNLPQSSFVDTTTTTCSSSAPAGEGGAIKNNLQLSSLIASESLN